MGSDVRVATLPILVRGGAPLRPPPAVAVTPRVVFSSGSTGTPKAIQHTHGGLLWWARSYTAHLQVFTA